jgi:hypothetical protein
MTEATGAEAMEDILKRLESARAEMMAAADGTDAALFDAQNSDGDSVKSTLERTVDEVNLYYGMLVAKALNLPQPPCLAAADFMSLREGTMALQVAHRRFGNLLHDVIPDDLEKTAADDHATYTLRQIMEMAIAHYNRRTQQLRSFHPKQPKRRSRQTRPG